MLNSFFSFLRQKQDLSKTSIVIFIVALLAAVSLSMYDRYDKLNLWETKYRQTFFTENTPMMTTLDAYKFLRHAKEFREGIYDPSKLDPMIFYPDSSPYPDVVPLLSVIVDYVSRITGKDLYMAGLYTVPVISSLFMVPLAIYFMILGYPAAGILAGLITTFAPMFYGRSAMGRLDTDGGNLFFLFAISLFILLATRAKKPLLVYVNAALAGLMTALFYWWYHHAAFNIAYLVTIVFALLFARAKYRDIIIATALFAVFSNPIFTLNAIHQVSHAVGIYLFPVKSAGGGAVFPNVYETIGEAAKDPIQDLLSFIIRNSAAVFLGIFGTILFVIGHFRAVIPLAPIAGLASMVFINQSGRFTMYLAPVVGLGIGYLITLMIAPIKEKNNAVKYVKNISIYAIAAIFFIIVTVTKNNGYGSMSAPSIQANTFRMFKEMKKIVPQTSAIYSWWDYGLAIADQVGAPVFHSGMTQETPKTWIIAKSFVGSQKTLHNTVAYLGNNGVSKLAEFTKDNLSLQEIENHIANYSENPINPNLYVLITEDMVSKMSAISFLANWSPKTGQSYPIFISPSYCQAVVGNTINCGDFRVNLENGMLNNNTPLKQIVFTSRGKVKDKKSYGYSQGYFLIVDEIGVAYLTDERGYESSLAQLYLLDEADKELFTLVMDWYPYGRLYRVNKVNVAPQP